MDRKSTAMFIGNRDCYGVNLDSIKSAIAYAVDSGITTFLNGGLGYFDEVCAELVYQFKQLHPHIKSILVIPYIGFEIFNKEIFDDIIYPFDEFEASSLTYRNAIPERNRYMVIQACTAITYVYRNGGASKTLSFAEKNNLTIIDIFSSSIYNQA